MKILMVTSDFPPDIGGIAAHVYELSRALVQAGHEVCVASVWKEEEGCHPCALISCHPCESRDLSSVQEDSSPQQRGSRRNDDGPEIPLQRRGARVAGGVVDLYNSPPEEGWRAKPDGVVDPSPHITCYRVNGSKRWGPFVFKFHRRALRKLVQQLCAEQSFDIIHIHGHSWESYATRAVSKQIPVVGTMHSSGFLRKAQTARGRKGLTHQLSYVKKLMAPSTEIADVCCQLGWKRDQVFFIPNGVDSTKFQRRGNDSEQAVAAGVETPYRASLQFMRLQGAELKDPAKSTTPPATRAPSVLRGMDSCFRRNDNGRGNDSNNGLDSPKIILCARRIVPKNGILFLVQAIPQVVQVDPQVLFVFAGSEDPQYGASIHEWIQQQHLDSYCVFLGSVPNQEMPDLMQLAEVSVLPSLVEATSITALESMAMELPIVGTMVGGIPELIEHEKQGLLVPPSDSEALAQAILRVLQNPDQAKQWGQAARERVVKEFDWQVIAERVIRIYSSLLGCHPSS